MRPLDPKSRAATLLLRRKIGMGYSAGPEFPGNTIRKSIDKLYKLELLADDAEGRMVITPKGEAYLDENHLIISIQ